MADRKQYVMTRKVVGTKPMIPGDVVELTDEQARSPIYRNRVRLHDSHLTPAVVAQEAPLEFGMKTDAKEPQAGAKEPQAGGSKK